MRKRIALFAVAVPLVFGAALLASWGFEDRATVAALAVVFV